MKRARQDVSSQGKGVNLDAFQRELIDLLPRLRRFARALTGDAVEADDLVQASVERALRKREQWRPGTRLDSWMYTLMKNVWIDESRRRSRRVLMFRPAEEGAHRAADPDPLATRLAGDAIERAMNKLSDEQRLAVALVLVEGLSYGEAAAVLHVPEGTLTSRLVRARQALMAELEGVAA
jgi:RNA polymerase sigma factor (sigma-70 family)